MTQIEQMAVWFARRGGVATLRDILQSGEPWAYEWRARATDARKRGYAITLERGRTPSENLYRMTEPLRYEVEDGGQVRMAV